MYRYSRVRVSSV